MARKYYGEPVISLRLPQWQISGLKLIARKENDSVSAVLRDMIAVLLQQYGITERSIETIDA